MSGPMPPDMPPELAEQFQAEIDNMLPTNAKKVELPHEKQRRQYLAKERMKKEEALKLKKYKQERRKKKRIKRAAQRRNKR